MFAQLCDAIVAELNAATFPKDFTATRGYLPRYTLEDMDTLHVTVVPKDLTISSASRGGAWKDYRIDIAVQQRAQGLHTDTLDGLVQLTESISDYLRTAPLTAMPQAKATDVTHEPVYVPEHLDQLHQFTSVVTVTYRLAV